MTLEFATQVMKCSSTKPRNNANYEKNYIAGRYGAVAGNTMRTKHFNVQEKHVKEIHVFLTRKDLQVKFWRKV